MGSSAGGHLVALLGTTDTRDNSDPALAQYSSRVNCVIDNFGPTDFTHGTLSERGTPLVQNLIGHTFAEAPQAYIDASPISHVDSKSVPFIIFQGAVDPTVPPDQSQRFYDALIKNGIEAKLTIFPGERHGMPKLPEHRALFQQEALDFLNRHLHPDAGSN